MQYVADKKEYIERDKVLEMSYSPSCATLDNPLAEIKSVVDYDDIVSIPAADVVEVRHGVWEDVVDHRHKVSVNPYQHTCGVCGKSYFDHNIFNYPYCPNCGAKMDGKEEGDNND